MTTDISPNAPASTLGTATDHNSVNPLDNTIADKMAAMISMRDQTRNLSPVAKDTETGSTTEAQVDEPVAPDNVNNIVEPEDSNDEYYVESNDEEANAPDTVSDADTNSSADELIDFIEFAETNPNAKFKFTRNGKEIVIDAKKAAAILGQGGAIHEEARELKVQRAEFDEYQKERHGHLEGLTLAMEFTIEPKLRNAYDEIIKTQQYQQTFQEQLANTYDPAQQARIQAAMEQNNRYIQQQSETIGQLKPRVDEFKQMRKQQVEQILDNNRKQFKDKELKNSYVFNEIRDKVSKDWSGAKGQLVPGVDNIDLISSDEHILSLIRDGLKYRDKPKSTSAGNSIAALTGKRTSNTATQTKGDTISKLREQANKGGKEGTRAADNLLMARLSQIRQGRR
jgi:hypothetical protein